MCVKQMSNFSGPLCIEIEKNQFMVASGVSLRARHLVN